MKIINIILSVLLLICAILIIFFLVQFFNLNDDSALSLNYSKIEDTYPKENKGAIIKRLAYHLSYNKEMKQANWASYLLTSEMVKQKVVERKNNFRVDDLVTSASPSDYTNSGYDKGHLVNAENMRWSEQAMNETFYMSNACPQLPGFNRGIWKKLENKVREWALENDSLIIITGPYLNEIIERIGENEIAVPKYYFKIILDISNKDGYKGVGFWMENKKSEDGLLIPLSIDDIEEKCQMDFFTDFQPDLINHIESIVEAGEWNLDNDI